MRLRFWLSWVCVSAFVISTLMLSWPLQRTLFVSPDENAAYVFATTLAQTGRLAIPEPLNEELGGLLHPRSAVGFGDSIIPGSFIGFIVVLGAIGAVFGTWAMFFVTPLLAVLTLLLWRDTVKRLFHDAWLADIAAFLLMIHPAFWYYSGRVMMHNVAFVAMLILAIWWSVAQPLSSLKVRNYKKFLRLLDFFMAGIWTGVALMIRTSEIFWMTLVVMMVFAYARSAIGWRAAVAFGLGVLIMLGVLAASNTAVYGGPLVNGYTAQYPYAAVVISDAETATVVDQPQTNVLLPFGFHERVIAYNVWSYGFKLYPWMSLLTVLGFMFAWTDKSDQRSIWKFMLLLTLVLAAWLGVVYGSWKIIDNPNPAIISLGNSHVRYWLPVFVLASLFGAKTLRFMLAGRTWPHRVLVGATVLMLVLLSGRLVFFGHDGVVPSLAALATFADKQSQIFSLTEEDAIIVVDRADKYLFPERRVVVPLRSEATYAALPVFLARTPVYYFGITLPAADIDYLNTQKLAPLGIRIELVTHMQEEALYRFVLSHE